MTPPHRQTRPNSKRTSLDPLQLRPCRQAPHTWGEMLCSTSRQGSQAGSTGQSWQGGSRCREQGERGPPEDSSSSSSPRCPQRSQVPGVGVVPVAAVALVVLALWGPGSPACAQNSAVLINQAAQLQPLVEMDLLTLPNCPGNNYTNCPADNCTYAKNEANRTSNATWSPEWYISCDTPGINVTSLGATNLANMSIPSSISSLWALTTLQLHNASMSGSLPSELGLLAGLSSLDLSDNRFTGSLPGTIFTLTQLQSLTLQDNAFNGTVLPQISQLTSLLHLDLGGNSFTGPIMQGVAPLSRLTYLNLSALNPLRATNWELSGPLDAFSDNFTDMAGIKDQTNLGSLKILDMSGMYLANLDDFNWSALTSLTTLDWTGVQNLGTSDLVLPRGLSKLSNLNITYSNTTITCQCVPAGETYNSDSAFCEYCNCNDHCSSVNTGAIVGGVVGGVVFILALLLGIYYALRARDYYGGARVFVDGVRRFSMAELELATNNYHKSNELGKGGFGEVYKGTLSSGEVVAVKRTVAKRRQQNVRGFDESFRNEILVLSGVGHVNLVKLKGYCSQKADLLLVYEFIPRGSVYDLLHPSKGEGEPPPPPLTWSRRLRIAHGAAVGLDYLHTGLNPPILHRDVKSQNILVDTNFNAKVADFGLSKIRPDAADKDGTQLRGTPGYLDPDYVETHKPTEKSDVYSFGVVLLELATGWHPVDRQNTHKHITAKVARAVNTPGQGFQSLVPACLLGGAEADDPAQGATPGVKTTTDRNTFSIEGGVSSGTGETSDPAQSLYEDPREPSASGSLAADAEPAGDSSSGGLPPHTGIAVEEPLAEGPEDFAVAPFSLELFIMFVKLGMQCCSKVPADRPLMRSVAKAIEELMEGRTELTAEVKLREDDKFDEDYVEEVVVLTHNVGGQAGSTVAFVMESGLQTRYLTHTAGG